MDYFKDNEVLGKYGLASMSFKPGSPMAIDSAFGPLPIGIDTPRQWELVFRVDDERYERLVSALRWSEERKVDTESEPSGPVRKMPAYWPPEIDLADFEWELETPRGRYKIKHR